MINGLSQRPTVMIPPLTEGQPTTLTCTAPGLCSGSEPTFTWRWRGRGESDADLTGNITAFKTENVAEFAKRRSSTLSFSPSAEHHGTNITCTVLFQGNVSTEETATLSVSFSPKHTHITESAEKQELDGRSSVMLSCFSHSFPPVQHYSWYRKSQGEEKDELVSEHQNHTVYSNQSGVYYCIAQNEVDQSLSDPVHLFEPTGNSLHILKFLVPALFVLMIIILIVIVLRLRRKKSIQQGTTNTKSPSGFSEQLSRPDAPEHQPLPDSTPPTDINLVYSILNLPQPVVYKVLESHT
ncbi:unnamed protein product [Pleuronectes platessa]|uniref:Ig-like domain-containing protein n=1 Tax=Pleuronectes platessa TaxID=8262 RepID=A0A9N7V1Q7_PLEPL|nr:unnamed protein product [Pleuronectes platessa]